MSYAREFFVATNGSDANSGTYSAPFATLEKAQAAVRALKASGWPSGGVAVTIRGGTYTRSTTLVLTSADSGTATSPAVWRSYPGETARLSGARRITGWTPVSSSDPNWSRVKTSAPLYRASIGLTGTALVENFTPLDSWAQSAAGDPTNGTGISHTAIPFQGDQAGTRPHPNLAELIYDGSVMTLARWPERRDDPAVSTSWLRAYPGSSSTVFTSGTSVAGRGWASIANLPAIDRPWAHIVGNGYDDKVVQMTSASDTTISIANGMGIAGGNQGRWAAVNLLEELSEPGEYWIDRTAGVVYFRAPGDANPATHVTEISQLKVPLVWADLTAQFIALDGLVFEGSQTFLMRIAGPNITVRNSVFRNAAGSGVLAGNSGDQIAGNKFYDLAGGGVVLVGLDARYMRPSGASNALVTDNEIYRVGRFAQSHVSAIVMGGGTGHVIQNNYIHDVPNIGVYALSRGALIEGNVFQRTGLHGFDHGAIYTWQNVGADTIIRYNVFRDVRMNTTYPGTNNEGYCVSGIYIDDGSTGYTTHSNIFYNFYKSDVSPYSLATPAITNKTGGNTYKNSVFANVWQIYAGYAAGSWMSNNQGWNFGVGFPAGSASNATANPNFIDPANGNFANQSNGTLVLVNGTQAIPASQIGPWN